MNNTQQKFRKIVPLFKDLPVAIFQTLDLSHFYIGNKEIETLRSDLENMIDHYVVTYKGDIFNLDIPPQTHLCALVKGAKLNYKQKKLLLEYEAKTKMQGITLVVFQKPLEIMDYKQSALFKEYLKRGLINE